MGWIVLIYHGFQVWSSRQEAQNPSWPKVFTGISFFSLQYYLSGYLSYWGWDLGPLTAALIITACLQFVVFDRTWVSNDDSISDSRLDLHLSDAHRHLSSWAFFIKAAAAVVVVVDLFGKGANPMTTPF